MPVWKEWKLRQQGFGRGPLSPPTPVAPRPPMTANPNSGGQPQSMGNSGRRLTLPGPGPSAGGRYNMYYPGTPPGRGIQTVPPPASSDWYGPGSWNQAAKKAAAMALARQIGRLSPVGRFLDVGFSIMSGDWGQTKPGTPAIPGGYNMTGWTLTCKTGGILNTGFVAGSPILNNICGIGGQVPNWTYGTPIPSGTRGIWLGTQTSPPPVWRGTVREAWRRPSPAPTPAVPYTPPQPATQPKYGPLPDSVPQSTPDPYHDLIPKVRSNPGPRRRVRDKPAPYTDGSNTTPGGTPVPSLPRPGEIKYKFPNYGGIGDLYGGLTEIKDGLKCVEKGMKGYSIPKGAGLTGRIHAAAQYMHNNPHKVDWQQILKCMVVNQIEDAVIGKANKLANQITRNPYYTRPGGVGLGSWAVRMG